MLIKTSQLTGLALDWAVAKCEFIGTLPINYYSGNCWTAEGEAYEPSTNWSQGGPILSSERISRTIDHSGLWVAYWTDGYGEEDYCKKWMQCDRSELVAGLRCYVASKLGDEVEVPEELA